MGLHPIRIAVCVGCGVEKRLYTTTTCSPCQKAAQRRVRQQAKAAQVYWCGQCGRRKVGKTGEPCAVCGPVYETATANDVAWAAWAGKEV